MPARINDMLSKESSDEKLLKLIEGTVTAKQQRQAGIARHPALALKINKFSFKKPDFKRLLKFRFDLPAVNKMAFSAAAVLTMVFFFNLISGTKKVNADLFFASLRVKEVIPPESQSDKKGFLSAAEYLSGIERRNIFLAPGQKPAEEIKAKEMRIVKVEEMFKDIKLVGIIWSDNPEAIIESSVDGRTSLVKKGDTAGSAKARVKEITRSSAILEIDTDGQKQEYELR